MRTLKIVNGTISLHGKNLFSSLTIEIRSPYPTTIMGPSGSGKSTLLNWLSGHLPSDFHVEGEAYIDQQKLNDLPPWKRRLGILFQDDLLFPHLTVGENLAFGVPPQVPSSERSKAVQSALLQGGLEAGFAKRDPRTLSGGQRARVALLRVLLSDPHVLLLDEPFSKLDQALRRKFRQEVFQECALRGIPILQVTHDDADAQAAGGPVVNLSAGSDA